MDPKRSTGIATIVELKLSESPFVATTPRVAGNTAVRSVGVADALNIMERARKYRNARSAS